ncbi:unnamed protein product [Ilex paraguariensis]|uniref:Uncharacterized protein n=1 Tax=Ilex paraguariensis TaxID=185542 RepID=A0ABC8UZ27_9AQUA
MGEKWEKVWRVFTIFMDLLTQIQDGGQEEGVGTELGLEDMLQKRVERKKVGLEVKLVNLEFCCFGGLIYPAHGSSLLAGEPETGKRPFLYSTRMYVSPKWGKLSEPLFNIRTGKLSEPLFNIRTGPGPGVV